MRMPAIPNLKSSTEGRTISISGDLNRFLTIGSETGGLYTQWEAIVPPGGGPPVHIHSHEEEAIFVLAGEITARIGNERTLLTPGMSARLPVGIPHGFRNESSHEARILFTAIPAGLENFFFEAGVDVGSKASSPPVSADEQHQQVMQAATKYGIRFTRESV